VPAGQVREWFFVSRGFYTSDGVRTQGRGEQRHLPLAFALAQNHPNPFGSTTTIAFELPRAGDVSLRLYDVAGREVAVLASGRWERGRHQVPVATDRLAPGAYYYVLKAGSTVETRNLLVRR